MKSEKVTSHRDEPQIPESTNFLSPHNLPPHFPLKLDSGDPTKTRQGVTPRGESANGKHLRRVRRRKSIPEAHNMGFLEAGDPFAGLCDAVGVVQPRSTTAAAWRSHMPFGSGAGPVAAIVAHTVAGA